MGGDIVVIIAIALIISGAAAYIIKAKRSGEKCIGCPYGKSCNGGCQSCGKSSDDKISENNE